MNGRSFFRPEASNQFGAMTGVWHSGAEVTGQHERPQRVASRPPNRDLYHPVTAFSFLVCRAIIERLPFAGLAAVAAYICQMSQPSPPGAGHLRELAAALRQLARRCRLPLSRHEMIELAQRLDRRAQLIDEHPPHI
jgi:hypothetical protein